MLPPYSPSDRSSEVDEISFEDSVRPAPMMGLSRASAQSTLGKTPGLGANPLLRKGERDPYSFTLDDDPLSSAQKKEKFDFGSFNKSFASKGVVSGNKIGQTTKKFSLTTGSAGAEKSFSSKAVPGKNKMGLDKLRAGLLDAKNPAASVASRTGTDNKYLGLASNSKTKREETLEDFLADSDGDDLPKPSSVGIKAASAATKMSLTVPSIRPTRGSAPDSSTSSPIGHVTFDDKMMKPHDSDCQSSRVEGQSDEDSGSPTAGMFANVKQWSENHSEEPSVLDSIEEEHSHRGKVQTWSSAALFSKSEKETVPISAKLEENRKKDQEEDSPDDAPFRKVTEFKPELLPTFPDELSVGSPVSERIGDSVPELISAEQVIKGPESSEKNVFAARKKPAPISIEEEPPSSFMPLREDKRKSPKRSKMTPTNFSPHMSPLGQSPATHNLSGRIRTDSNALGSTSFQSQTYADDFDPESDGDDNNGDEFGHAAEKRREEGGISNAERSRERSLRVPSSGTRPMAVTVFGARGSASKGATPKSSSARSSPSHVRGYDNGFYHNSTPHTPTTRTPTARMLQPSNAERERENRPRKVMVDVGIQAAVPQDASCQCDDLLPQCPPLGTTGGSTGSFFNPSMGVGVGMGTMGMGTMGGNTSATGEPCAQQPGPFSWAYGAPDPRMTIPSMPMMHPMMMPGMMPWGGYYPGMPGQFQVANPYAFVGDPASCMRPPYFRNAPMDGVFRGKDSEAGSEKDPADNDSASKVVINSALQKISPMDEGFRNQLLQLRKHAERNRHRLETLIDKEFEGKRSWYAARTAQTRIRETEGEKKLEQRDVRIDAELESDENGETDEVVNFETNIEVEDAE